MSFPINPTNGQTATVNGVIYTYSNTLTAWSVTTNVGANISANNISAVLAITGATVSASGSVTGASTVGGVITGSSVSVTGGVTGASTVGGVITGSSVSVTGGVTGASTVGGVITGSSVSVTGGVTGGNLVTGGTISATGNVNLSTAGKYVRNTAGGVPSTSARFALTTANVLDVHINTSVAGNSGSNTQQYGMSFSNASGATQAAIVCSENGSDGTSIGIFTSNNYTAGPQLRAFWDTSGNLLPAANATYDLGSSTARWKTVYTTDLELNNGIGDYTVVEGADDLFLYNNRSGKVFKFALIEVDPATAPPKAKS